MDKICYLLVHDISRFIAFCIFKLFFRMSVTGRENIPERGGFIVASNHLSYLDPPAVGSACPRRLSYMARHDLFSSKRASWFYRNWGAFPVKRGSADISALKEALRRLKAGGGLLLFPEGRRIEGERSGKPQGGIGFIALKAQVPVIPACVRGTDKALPRGAKFFKFTKVSVSFGKPIIFEKGLPYEAIAERIMENIRAIAS